MKKTPPKKNVTHKQPNKKTKSTKKSLKTKPNVSKTAKKKKRLQSDTQSKKIDHRLKTKRPNKKRRKKKQKHSFLKQVILELVITVAIAIVLIGFVSQFTIALPSIEGYSMTPTIDNGERVLVNKFGTIKRFSLVYFQIPEKKELAVRRVIGLPNEEIKYKNDQLLVNSEEITERFLTAQKNDAKQQAFLFTADFSIEQKTNQRVIPKDNYLVMGDNRLYATDSRQFGLVSKKDIVGVVEARVFPLTRF